MGRNCGGRFADHTDLHPVIVGVKPILVPVVLVFVEGDILAIYPLIKNPGTTGGTLLIIEQRIALLFVGLVRNNIGLNKRDADVRNRHPANELHGKIVDQLHTLKIGPIL